MYPLPRTFWFKVFKGRDLSLDLVWAKSGLGLGLLRVETQIPCGNDNQKSNSNCKFWRSLNASTPGLGSRASFYFAGSGSSCLSSVLVWLRVGTDEDFDKG